MDGPRRWLVRLPKDWSEGKRLPAAYREKWALFIECPYCAGFHVSLAVYLFWVFFPYETLVASMPFVLNAGVIGMSKILGMEEE